MKKNINQIFRNEKKIIFLLIGTSFIIRLIALYFYHDTKMDNEWGVLLNNLIKYQTYSFFSFNNTLLPSVLVPPLYVYFLFFIKIIAIEKINFLNTLFFFQIILSTLSVYIFYKINKKFFSEKICTINAIIFSLFPLNIYAAGQISSATLQIFLSLLFLLFVFIIGEKQIRKNFLIFAFISGLLILVRGEFVFIYLITLLYFLYKKKIKFINLLLTILLTLAVISPYLVRNYIVFKEVVLVKSFGYNLWKGNNQFSSVEGHSGIENAIFKNLKKKLGALEKDNFYEINRDQIFFNEALKNIGNNPLNYLNLFVKKLFSFYFVNFNSSYPNYYNFFHILPATIISLFSFPGLVLVWKKRDFKIEYLKIYLILTITIFSVFFILPRYKLTILPIQIMLVGYFIVYLMNKIKKKDD